MAAHPSLKEKLETEAKCLDHGVICMNSFLNHQVDTHLLKWVGEEFARRFAADKPTKVLTAETSGLLPALSVATALGVPMLFARKERTLTMIQEPYIADAKSHTHGGRIKLYVASEFLLPSDRVIIIDDVLATAITTLALVDIVNQSGAHLIGVGAVIEKCYENGRLNLADLHVHVETLAKIAKVTPGGIVFAD